MTMKRFATSVTVMAALSLLISCGREPAAEIETQVFDIEKSYSRGPLELTLLVTRDTITIAEELELVLEVNFAFGYEVTIPAIGQALSDFSITDYTVSPTQQRENDRLELRRTYVLEPFLSGEYTIPALTIVYQKDDEEQTHELVTEPMTITVTSLLPEQMEELTIRDIVGPVHLSTPPRTWLWITIAVASVLGAGSVLMFFLLRKRRSAAAAALPADEVAYRQIEELLAAGLIEDGKIKEFYTRMSDILRHYIENRFGFRAPEQTTEEFTAELRESSILGADQKQLLETFLNHCDSVKFAEYLPANEEIEQSFDHMKAFVVASKEEPS